MACIPDAARDSTAQRKVLRRCAREAQSGGADSRALACGLLACAFFIVAASAQAAPHATIRWTAHGIPHIEASDYEGLGYGYGYAFAQPKLV